MADNTINVRIKDRSDTEANWTSKNPVLLKGERAITDGTGKYKIGDGKNTWGALPYYEAMTSADRTKLNGIASGANKTTVDSSLSSSSTNPVQNKVVNSALAGKSNTNHTHDLSTMINTLSTGGSTPTDEDYFVSQCAGGGTTTTTYHRRPVKALLEYIKGKLAKVAISGSYNDLSNKPTIPNVGNGTITIKQAGAVKGSFTTNQSGATTIELTDNNTNTWRGIQNNLTSTSTDQSLSAVQGKWLNENKAAMTTLKGSENLNDITTPGMYSCSGENSITNKPSNVDAFGLIVTHNANGSFYTQILHSNGGVSYRRNCNNGTWASWTEEKHTDTVYTHPSYTAKSNGLYRVTVDSKGHVSGTTAVSKADITALGIPSTNTTYSTGTASISGLTKLYTGTGTATDGTMTQSAIKSALDGKSNNGHTHDDRYYTESEMNTKLSGKSDTSHTHNRIVSRGDVTAETGADGRPAVEGLSMSQAYNNGYPTSYGNVINLRGAGDGQILVGWSGSDKGYAPVYVRNKRDNTTTADWSSWQQFYTTGYKPTKADVGLGNVDNTADSAKSVSYANSAGNASKVNNHTVNSNVPSGAKFTDTVYSHPTTSGNKHIPSGGSSGQILRWSSDGTAVWGNDNNTTYTLSSITGTLAVSKGGTGSTTAAGGRFNLGAVGFVCQSAEPSGQNNGDLWFKEE